MRGQTRPSHGKKFVGYVQLRRDVIPNVLIRTSSDIAVNLLLLARYILSTAARWSETKLKRLGDPPWEVM
jgi:hypothetical protein